MGLPLLDYKIQLHYPGFIFGSIFYFGLGTGFYWGGRALLRLGKRIMTYFKTTNNASKYINSRMGGEERDQTYTAVIYGAGTKAGRIYAHFLAHKGFNLVLVEREAHSLSMLAQTIKFDVVKDPLITTIVMDKFDMDTFSKTVAQKMEAHKSSPVKLFINCKNSRRKQQPERAHTKQHTAQLQDSIGESCMLNESVLNEEERYTLMQLWEPAITREEIFFTGKENVEGFVSLLSYFLPEMVSKEVDHPALINIDNVDFNENEQKEVRAGSLFYQAVMQFKDTFTKNLPRHVRNRVHSITVKTDFSNLPAQASREDVQSQLCMNAFASLNINESISVQFPPSADKSEEKSNMAAGRDGGAAGQGS